MVKRLFDLVISLVGIVILSPVMAIIAILIKLNSPGPIVYAGHRVGKGGKPFRLLKFRTMVVNADKIGGPSTSDDDPRVTKIGHILRRYKLDEIPQLFNVLKGEMSLVGPRPEVAAEVALYSPEERNLLNVAPGITDWASIRFHNEGEILKGSADPHRTYQEKIRPEKIRLGLEYVQEHSFFVDVKILLSTFGTLVKTRVKSQAAADL
ncbi:MAG TPA: sugar transferase [Bryobacteraceae bacterium]|nr:sugar transferase [Bryobacteraceae bacterium]